MPRLRESSLPSEPKASLRLTMFYLLTVVLLEGTTCVKY